MVKLACMTLPYAKYPFERALEGISRSGYKYVAFGLAHAGVEVPDENDERAIEKLQQVFAKYALQPVMLIGNQQFAVGQPIERVRKRLQTAKALGIEEVISVGTGSYRRFPDELLSDEEQERNNQAFVEQFRKVGAEAQALGIMVTLKPHTGNTATASHMLETLQQIGSPHIRISYDPGNVQFYEGVNAEADFQQIADRTYSLIAKDHRGARANADFPVPGTGDVNFAAMFKAMKDTGFGGSIVVERVDGPDHVDLIDQRMNESRMQLERLMKEAGLELS